MHEPDIEIVGEASDAIDVLLKVGNTNAEAVAIDLPSCGKDSGLCSHLLAEYPEVKVFAVSEEGDEVIMYETAMVRKQAINKSVEDLASLIRLSVRGDDNNRHDMLRLL
jgi:DNA-binding NarL/FixJ family response regulator